MWFLSVYILNNSIEALTTNSFWGEKVYEEIKKTIKDE